MKDRLPPSAFKLLYCLLTLSPWHRIQPNLAVDLLQKWQEEEEALEEAVDQDDDDQMTRPGV